MPALYVNICYRIFFPCYFSSQGCLPMIGCRGCEIFFWVFGGVNSTKFLVVCSSLCFQWVSLFLLKECLHRPLSWTPTANFYIPISIIIIIIIFIIILVSPTLSETWSPQLISPATSVLGKHSQFLHTNFHHHHHHHHHHTRLGSLKGTLVSTSNVASDLYPGQPPTNFKNPGSLRLHLPLESILISVGHVLDELHVLSETFFLRILIPVVWMFNYFLLCPTNAQLSHKLPHSSYIIVIKQLNAQNLAS